MLVGLTFYRGAELLAWRQYCAYRRRHTAAYLMMMMQTEGSMMQ